MTTSQLQGQNAAIPGGGVSAFTIPAPFTFGNVGRTLPDVRSPAFTNFDMALGKQFKL